MGEQAKTVLLHVGCRKSGTSALQRGLRNALDELRGQGLEQPLVGRGQVLRGLETDLERARSVLPDVASWIRESPHPRHLVALEALAEWPAEAAALVVSALAEFDTRLVVTARPWAVTVPSEWQQRVKGRFTTPYEQYVDAVLAPERTAGGLAAEATLFRGRQDVEDIVRRWRSGVPDLPVDLVLVPIDREARPGLRDLFCEATGIDPGLVGVTERGRNESLSHEDAEALRLVNVALGDRLPDPRGDYRRHVRQWIAVGTMTGRSTGTRARLPARWEEQAAAEAARQLDAVRAEGCTIWGDAERFVQPDLPGEDFVPATDAAVAEAAATVLAELAVRHEDQQPGGGRRRRGSPS